MDHKNSLSYFKFIPNKNNLALNRLHMMQVKQYLRYLSLFPKISISS